jgi:hypothetical protein
MIRFDHPCLRSALFNRVWADARQPGIFVPVSSGPTISHTMDASVKDASTVLRAINTVQAAARAQVWGISRPARPVRCQNSVHSPLTSCFLTRLDGSPYSLISPPSTR